MSDPDRVRGVQGAPFDELLTEVLDRVKDARDEQIRWRLLLQAVVTMAAGLSLDELLTRIVEVARDLVAARYGALGVLGNGGPRRLRLFVTSGMGQEQIDAIGDLPSGHGILGLLIDSPEAVRLHDITTHPTSYGFPAHHPPMHSFLGVPVRTAGTVFGNLYLAEKEGGGDFTAQDEEIVIALAAAAGVAIENARLHDEAARRERWLDARAEVMSALMGDTDRRDALQLVAERAREIADADLAWIMTGPDPDSLHVDVVAGRSSDPADIGSDVASAALRAGTPVTVADVGGDKEDPTSIGPAVMVPLSIAGSGDDVAGVLALAWTRARAERSRDVDLGVATAFAEQVAIALRLARSRADQRQLAVYDDRERIGRDLHDVVIQRLFGIGLRLQAAIRASDDPSLRERLDTSVDEIDATIANIRSTIFELKQGDRPRDLMAALLAEIDRAATSLGFRPDVRFSGPVRRGVPNSFNDDAVAVLAEALSNVVRHAEASSVHVAVSAGSHLTIEVSDNGRGLPPAVAESGLGNLRRRAVDRDGQFSIAAENPGTRLTWSVPLP